MEPCAPKHHPERLDGVAAQWDTGDLEPRHVHRRYSGSMVQMGIQEPLDSAELDNDGAGAECAAAPTAHRSARPDSLG